MTKEMRELYNAIKAKKEEAKALVLENKITEGHARSLLCFEDPEQQYKAALDIIAKGQNCRDIEQRVKNKKKAQKRDPKYDAILQDIEGTFQGYFGTKVRLEAGKRSGSLITVEFALLQGKDIFVIPGDINNPMSKGTNSLIKDGAILVDSYDEINLKND